MRQWKQLGEVLVAASITNTLSHSHAATLNLPRAVALGLTQPLILKILSNQSIHPSQKLRFFEWSRSHHNPSPAAYSLVLRSLTGAGFFSDVPSLLHSMTEDGVVLDPHSLNLLLHSFIFSSNFNLAFQLLDYVQHLQLDATTIYNSLIAALLTKNQLSLALSIFFKLLDTVDSKSIACNQLLVALRKADMRVEFKQVFTKLREKKGFSFDTWGYNVCIHAFGCWGDLASCFALFKEMKDDGKGLVSPDLCTYNSLITALCRLGKVDDALVVWEELNASVHQPDRFTYTNLIHACCGTFRMGDATRVFNHMQSHGFRPDTLVYNSLLDGHFKATKVVEACQLFEKMVQEGLCKEGQLEEALQLVEEMESRGFTVDLVTITSLLISIHRHGRWDWTDRLMKYIREGDLVVSVLKWKAGMEASMKNPPGKKKDYSPMFPSKGDFSDIVSFMTRAQDTTNINDGEETSCDGIDEWSSSPHMDKLANQMCSTGYSSQLFTPSRGQRVQEKGPDSFDVDMVNTFLSIFLAKGKLSLACKLFEIFSDAGVSPVSYSYNSIMSSFVKKGYFTEAWAVLTEMGEQICPADIATYNMIIQGLGKMGRADLASAVLDTLLKQGGYLDIVMYNTLINALGKAGRIKEVNKLFEQMRSSGINPDVVTYNTLIEVHSKAGLLKDAYKFLKMMLDAGCTPNHVTDTTLDYLGREIDKLRFQRASILSEKDDPS
ncbi:hypothetical protein PHAVU_011G061000 [Phaseolus vulgaris]|uniref:Pentacotripeptide-repeat region of PRORP domain-containing protein n=1 Tax=Phaseolus vulgaris TaxID=3885 RepID=V7AIU2_PHAVU|nr:hypothetical protein PHAVU_011G061000g [Phaseolus vulgaris]ESW04026.1 hypothetical protein PHAVU_011G061000g [Phaseolus vulgaris]